MPEQRNPRLHQPAGVFSGRVVVAACVLLALILIALSVVAGAFSWYGVPVMGGGSGRRVADFPKPELQVSPSAALADLRQRWRKQLDSYHWVDRERGLVRIPVERAMEIVATRGKDAYSPLGNAEPGAGPAKDGSKGESGTETQNNPGKAGTNQ